MSPEVQITIVLDNLSMHQSAKTDQRVGEWAAANNVEFAYAPAYLSCLNRIEANSRRWGQFALGGHPPLQLRRASSTIRRHI